MITAGKAALLDTCPRRKTCFFFFGPSPFRNKFIISMSFCSTFLFYPSAIAAGLSRRISALCELRLFMSDLFITRPLRPRPTPLYLSYSSLLNHGYIKDIPIEADLSRLGSSRQNLCDLLNNSQDDVEPRIWVLFTPPCINKSPPPPPIWTHQITLLQRVKSQPYCTSSSRNKNGGQE